MHRVLSGRLSGPVAALFRTRERLPGPIAGRQRGRERRPTPLQPCIGPTETFPMVPQCGTASGLPAPGRSGDLAPPRSADDLVERILDDADRAGAEQLRDELAHRRLGDDTLDGEPI